jgi:HEAT repeat protein/phosphoglycerol transferase MdoB-like AlkP superfamily enzyme
MVRLIARAAIAGFAVALVEVALVVGHDRALFLTANEIARYLALAPAACLAATLLVALVLGSVHAWIARSVSGDAERTARRAGAVAALPVFAWTVVALAALTEGRRARELPGRWVVIAIGAAGAAWLVDRIVCSLLGRMAAQEHSRSATVARSLLFALLAIVALALDAWVLRRLYPAFHASLAALAMLSALAAVAWPMPRDAPPARGFMPGAPGVVAGFALLVALTLPIQVSLLVGAPNAGFAIEQSAPWTGKLARLARAFASRGAPLPPGANEAGRAPADTGWSAPGVDLRGRDVLLITIDALRADRLRAFGGAGLTPNLDRLAETSLVFRRAYTATPHTSYALASLLTSKHVGDIARLGGGAEGHVTLPALLRAHGYRTAAFYPPSVFFVDGERFEALARERFAFEYAKVMFADAHARVAQLASYLAEAPAGHPLFVWVHLFEPHEPYDPPERFRRGETPVEHYDGEVATADDAAGGLVETFRRARPGATVIVTSDHGEEFGDHGGLHHGTTLYDEQVRVPLLWSSAGVAPGAVEHAVSAVDIGTTLLAALGIPREARMRGRDLGAVLAGTGRAGGGFAFASIADARMVTDGRHKAICGHRGDCRLFDLVADPRERDDIALGAADVLARLRATLAQHVAATAREEVLAIEGGGAWPEALARAQLGDATAGAALVPHLGDARAAVRGAAARAVGDLGVHAARTVLARMRAEDADECVRAEAAIAALVLGDASAREGSAAALARGKGDALARRAALALASAGDASGTGVLVAVASDDSAEETQRVAAVRALGEVGARAPEGTLDIVNALVGVLRHVRLRPEAATALGHVGDRRAVRPLLEALSGERYPAARAAEARALVALGERKAAALLVRRFLGTDSSVPDGVAILLDTGTLDPPSGLGADLQGVSARASAPQFLRGAWQCGARGCRPGEGASIVLSVKGTPLGALRVVLRIDAEGAGTVRVGGTTHEVDAGTSEHAFALPSRVPAAEARRGGRFARAPREIEVAIEMQASSWLAAFAVVSAQPDIPPPPPEPWTPDAGTAE